MIPVHAKPTSALTLIFSVMLPLWGCVSGTDSATLSPPDDNARSDRDTDTDTEADPAYEPTLSPADDLGNLFVAAANDTSGTGGEPSDTKSGDTEVDAEAHCDTETPVELNLRSKGAHAMVSPVLARAIINEGGRVTKAIRTYEFLNYYRFDYLSAELSAEAGHVNVSAALHAEEPVAEMGTPRYLLQIGVSAPAAAAQPRLPLSLTLSIDTSESMAGHGLDMAKASCMAIAGALQNGDLISVVTWATEPIVLLASRIVRSPNDTRLVAACEALSVDGSTDPHTGLIQTYALARGNFDKGFTNRVILMSDGGAQLGVTDEELVAGEADDTDGKGIYLVGVGMANTGADFNDRLLDTLTAAGKGTNIYIDSAEEAEKMLGDRFITNLTVAASDVTVALSLPPSFEAIDFDGAPSVGHAQESDLQYLAPGATMIFQQALTSCDAAAFTTDSIISVSAIYKAPSTLVQSEERYETTVGLLLDADAALLLKGSAIATYARTLKSLKTLEGDEARRLIDETLVTVNAAAGAQTDDPDLQEIGKLLSTYRKSFPISIL